MYINSKNNTSSQLPYRIVQRQRQHQVGYMEQGGSFHRNPRRLLWTCIFVGFLVKLNGDVLVTAWSQCVLPLEQKITQFSSLALGSDQIALMML